MICKLRIIFFCNTLFFDLSLNKIITMKKKIAIHLADGFEEIEAISIID